MTSRAGLKTAVANASAIAACLFPSYLYVFTNAEYERVGTDMHGSCDGEYPQISFLNNLLLGQWEDRMSKGLFSPLMRPNSTSPKWVKRKCSLGLNKGNRSHYFPSSLVDVEKGSPSVVVINKMDSDSVLLALHLAKEASDPFFRVGYNSLGAFATINHLHFQAYYLPVPLPIEKALTRRTMRSTGPYEIRLVVSELLNYPV